MVKIFNWCPPKIQTYIRHYIVASSYSCFLAESITSGSVGRSGTVNSSLGKRKKSIDELNNNSSTSSNINSTGAAAAVADQEEDGVNVEDSGDEGSLSRGEAQRKKKARTTFTGRQIFELEKQFELKKYLSSSERADMAKLLNVTETQVGALFMPFFYRIVCYQRGAYHHLEGIDRY